MRAGFKREQRDNIADYRDRYVRESLRHDFLERHLIETDTVADPFAYNPRELLGQLDSLDNAYRTAAKEQTVAKLVTPFDYPNCEQMGKSHLLLKSLYSDRVLGLSEIQARANLVLTGPRGCGKTTVFRALSLEYCSLSAMITQKVLTTLGSTTDATICISLSQGISVLIVPKLWMCPCIS